MQQLNNDLKLAAGRERKKYALLLVNRYER